MLAQYIYAILLLLSTCSLQSKDTSKAALGFGAIIGLTIAHQKLSKPHEDGKNGYKKLAKKITKKNHTQLQKSLLSTSLTSRKTKAVKFNSQAEILTIREKKDTYKQVFDKHKPYY